jgi:hypothetical protein
VKEYERPYIIHKTILTTDRASLISERIEAWENSLPLLKLAYLPSPEKCVYVFRLGNKQGITGNGYRRIRGFSEPDY